MSTTTQAKALRRGVFQHVEAELFAYPYLKKEIAFLKHLQELSESGELPLELKGYAATSGITIYMENPSEEEIGFFERYKENQDEMMERFGVPCRNHVLDAEFCGAFFIHMSKCSAVEGNGCKSCPLFEMGYPTESHKFKRISERWLYKHSEVEKEIVRYLHAGEIPQPELLRFAYDMTQNSGNQKEYLKKKNKIARERRPLPLSLRFKVLDRDNFTCVYCGSSPTKDGVKLHIDHVLAHSKGGEDELENLVTACEECNLGKNDRDLISEVRN